MDALQSFAAEPGIPDKVTPLIRRILAPNPSPFTGPGTNTYLVGHRQLAVIDPGPESDDHLTAILAALGPEQTVSHILVTHAHVDHSPLARRLSAITGAPVLAYGDAVTGRSDIMNELAETCEIGGGEGRDMEFRPDIELANGASVDGDGWRIEAIWTPGHFGNHLCFDLDGVVFTGDLVMGWATSLVSPPDGDLTDFMTSCRVLGTRPSRLFLPGHGPEIESPAARLEWLIAHRMAREASILRALKDGPGTPKQLTYRVYTDIEPYLFPAAQRNLLAHLIDLTRRGLVTPEETLSAEAVFQLK